MADARLTLAAAPPSMKLKAFLIFDVLAELESCDVSGRNALESKEETKRPFRRKLPPLPKNDIKVIIRPKQGLTVRDFPNHQVARAIAAACGNSETCKDEYLLIRLRNGSNIIIASTPQEEAANFIRRITKLTLDSKSYEVNAYVATPDGVVRGVVHGIDAGTPPEELMAHLRVRTQGVKILQARMLGKSKTAVITFDGKVVPRFVNYYGGEEPCHLYRPTRQVCYICLKLGHRSDVCPTPELRVCQQCGLCNPETGHTCVPKCVLCSEAHLTGARECKDRLKKARRPPSHNQEKDGGRNTRRSRKDGSDGKDTRRWFSSEGGYLREPQPVPFDVDNEAAAGRKEPKPGEEKEQENQKGTVYYTVDTLDKRILLVSCPVVERAGGETTERRAYKAAASSTSCRGNSWAFTF
ncbi:hypothetical protein MTO96_029653 [Rhipicephalus appendiculatus]